MKQLSVIILITITILIASCTSSENQSNVTSKRVSFATPRIQKVENTYNEVFITLNKVPRGTAYLHDKAKTYRTKAYQIDGNIIRFRLSYLKTNTCLLLVFETNIQRYATTPNGRSYKGDWCFENTLRDKYINALHNEKQKDKKLSILHENLDQLNALSDNFPEQCTNPTPIAPVQPAQYCSSKPIVIEKLNQCDAPLIARICKSGTPILLNKELSKSESRALTPACKIFADQWVGKETKPSDLALAQVKAELISHAGSFKEGVAWTVALLETSSCKGRIHSQCNPKQPTAPDCTEWEGHINKTTDLSVEIQLLEFNKTKFTTNINRVKNEVETINF